MAVSLKVQGGADIAAFGRRMRRHAAAKTLLRQTRKEIRAAAKPAVTDVKKVIRGLPVKGVHGGGAGQRRTAKASAGRSTRGTHGLRATIARGVALRLVFSGQRAGVRIVIRKSVLPEDQQSLIRHMNDPKGWRHPLFGDAEHWYRQLVTSAPWWYPTLKRHLPAARAGVQRAIAQTIDIIGRG